MYKKIFKDKKAIIFDLDGTIVKDTVEIRKQTYEKVLADMNLSYVNPRPYCVPGYSSAVVWDAILEGNNLKKYKISDLVTKTRDTYLKLIKEVELEPVEGFWDILYEFKEVKKYKVALVTNSPKNIQEFVMEKLKIKDTFDVTVFGDEVRKNKPDPEIFKKALKKLGISVKEALAFEDSVPGVKACNKIKLDTIVIWDGKTRKSLFGNKVIEFSPDFTPYPESLDETHGEYLLKSFKAAARSKK
jgi:beta-phosphoglucomutase